MQHSTIEFLDNLTYEEGEEKIKKEVTELLGYSIF